MAPEIAGAAPGIVNAFGDTGGILGLIILALLSIVGLVSYMGWNFMTGLMKAHESRMDTQEQRHQRDRETANQQWQQVTREITHDMKSVLDTFSRTQASAITTLERVDRNVEALKRRKAA